MRRTTGLAIVITAALSSAACEFTPITQTRIESSVGPTFANLVTLQMSWLGMPPMSTTDLSVRARCRRPSGQNSGSGEWTCSLLWQGPTGRMLRDSYELFVTTDGCYSATASSDGIGPPTLKTDSGREVRNLLYAFEGCFDTT
ncbi:MAG TPA: hypothetical protein VGF24_14300 [Vicinamibacterales bacterium]